MTETTNIEPIAVAEFDKDVDAVIIAPASALRAKRQEMWNLIEAEMKRAKKTYPSWPVHAAAQAGVVVKQSGDLMKAAINVKYRRGNGLSSERLEMKRSAIKTIVAAMRLLENI